MDKYCDICEFGYFGAVPKWKDFFRWGQSYKSSRTISDNAGMFSSGLGLDSAPVWGMQYTDQVGEDATQGEVRVQPARECFFNVEGHTREVGSCTFYGACRYQGQDYMYQVRFY